MNALGFRADQKIMDVIGRGEFTLSAEVIPSRNGTEQKKVFDQVSKLIHHGAQFLSVTKGAGGSLRGGSLPIAQAIKEGFQVPCIAHFTCRDLTPQDVENQLVDHHYFGIRNILALRGDPPQDQKEWIPKEGSYSYAYLLIEQIRKLNEGVYLTRPSQKGHVVREKTDFCIGAACYPEHPDPKERLEFFKKKADAGAEYGITQMVFDPEAYARFLDLCHKNGVNIPILPGTRLLRSRQQAERMASRFEVSVPKETLQALPDESEADSKIQQSVEYFIKMIDRLKAYGAPGIHLFVLTDTEGSTLVLSELAKRNKKVTEKPKSQLHP